MARARANKLVACLALCAGLCLAWSPGRTDDLDQQLAEAEALRAQAAAAGAEWLNTGKLLDQAREAVASGDTAMALALIEEARFQAEAAIEQAQHEEQAWRSRVLQ